MLWAHMQLSESYGVSEGEKLFISTSVIEMLKDLSEIVFLLYWDLYKGWFFPLKSHCID